MRAEVVAVGSEMLTPTHIDTNSLFITERLNELGIDLQGKAVAGDDRDALKAIVADALRRTDLLILTGGLGPTDDDMTRDVVADLIGRPLEYHPDIFEAIEGRFAARGLRTPEINRRQAMVPRGAVVLPNNYGTAPGLWIEHDAKFVVLLPGPPRELKPMFEALIQERLTGRAGSARLFRRVLRVTGRSESYVEEKMQPLYAKWLAAPSRILTTILASLGQIELHLTVIAPTAADGHYALEAAAADVSAVLGQDLFALNGETMQQIIGELCVSRGLRIAAAESCTGGLVMARLTEVPGSSAYVDRGVVVYSNQSKVDLLAGSRGAHRGAGGRERAGRRGHGRRDGPRRRRGSRSRDHGGRRSVRRDGGKACRHGRDCRRVAAARHHRDARPNVQLPRGARVGPISGVAGRARHAAALAHRVKRLFIAIDVDEPVRRAIGLMASEASRVLRGVSWVRPDRMHLTLFFFGRADGPMEQRLRGALAEPVPHAPFDLSLDGFGLFPSAGPPRVLWLGVRDGLADLLRVHETLARRLTLTDAFTPHLTLGRFRSSTRAQGVLRRLSRIHASAGPCRIDRVTLYESRLTQAGPAYVPLAEALLADGPAKAGHYESGVERPG